MSGKAVSGQRSAVSRRAVMLKAEERSFFVQCPMPHAQCPMPNITKLKTLPIAVTRFLSSPDNFLYS
ncbi:MAG: hypothetical protein F6J93_16610 [Oscillatoria sp. SIO1A7]|nr:hypothetical protein [Oscillatoria sp. SIO1A7]